MFIQLTGIYPDMMFLYFNTGRDKLITPGNSIWKLFPSIFTKLSGQFVLTHVMIDTPDRKSCYIRSLFFQPVFSSLTLLVPDLPALVLQDHRPLPLH